MQDSIYNNNFIEFKKIYENEYLYNDNIIDYFKFDEEEHYLWFNNYSLCDCNFKDDEQYRIHKHLNVRPCSCANGKRYLTYLCTHNASFKDYCCFYDTDLKNVKEYTKITNDGIFHNIQTYLKENGPIDLNYTNMIYDKSR